MYKKFKLVKIDSDYCDYLRKYDFRVCYNAGKKEMRPFIGVLFMVGNYEYFAPLSSPKPKHASLKNTLDLLKIKNGIYGVINFNNMIPVTSKNYKEFDLNRKSNNKEEMYRINLLSNQLRWLNLNKKDVFRKSELLYKMYLSNRLTNNVKDRCCNFPLLEEKCKEYNKQNN
jgi:protein AbiQ